MIPILYSSEETAFESNGLGRLADCVSCVVTEERNGIYECKFTYPVSGEMYGEIKEGRIVGVIHDDAKDVQPFDIYAHSAPIDGLVTFYAHHISYRLGNVILKPMSAGSVADAFAAIPRNTYNTCPFTFWTDKVTTGTWTNKVPAAVKAILGGQQGSILDVYGKGEYQWDRWTVRLYVDRGNDNGVSIRYGVNLTDLQQDYDESGVYNAVAPYWVSAEGDTVVSLPEGVVISDKAPTHPEPWTDNNGNTMTDGNGEIIYFNVLGSFAPVPMDLSGEFEEAPTEAQLRAKALSKLNSSEAWLPSENITVKFVNLADTEEYKDVAALQRVSLCDKVSVYCGPLGVSAVKMQVIRTEYNVLNERYDSIELGKAKTSFAQTVMAAVEEATKDLPTVSMLQTAINNATDQISGAKNSHVKFVYDANGGLQEILIMDTDDIDTAVKVWRWNSGGLGFSSNGYAGPYGTAITQDGQIVADFITAGKMLANIIKGGTLTLGGDNNENGVLEINDKDGNLIGRWSNYGITIKSGVILADVIKGGTLQLGGRNNTNGRLEIRDSWNDVIGMWNNDGIKLLSGKIASYDDSNYWDLDDGYFVAQNAMLGPFSVSNSMFKYTNGGYAVSIGNLDDITHAGIALSYDNEDSQNLFTIDALNNALVWYKDNQEIARFEMSIAIDSDRSDFIFGVYSGGEWIDTIIVNGNGNGVHLNNAILGSAYVENDMKVHGGLEVGGSLSVRGTKPRLVTTDQYAERFLYCYETPTPMFGDIGEGVIAEDGLCYVWLDPVFAQTIVTDQYQVFLQRYGEGDCHVTQRRGGCFVVQGTPGLAFGWEVKAKQRDYDQLRLDKKEEKFTVPTQTYGEDAVKHVQEIQKEREYAA